MPAATSGACMDPGRQGDGWRPENRALCFSKPCVRSPLQALRPSPVRRKGTGLSRRFSPPRISIRRDGLGDPGRPGGLSQSLDSVIHS